MLAIIASISDLMVVRSRAEMKDGWKRQESATLEANLAGLMRQR